MGLRLGIEVVDSVGRVVCCVVGGVNGNILMEV